MITQNVAKVFGIKAWNICLRSSEKNSIILTLTLPSIRRCKRCITTVKKKKKYWRRPTNLRWHCVCKLRIHLNFVYGIFHTLSTLRCERVLAMSTWHLSIELSESKNVNLLLFLAHIPLRVIHCVIGCKWTTPNSSFHSFIDFYFINLLISMGICCSTNSGSCAKIFELNIIWHWHKIHMSTLCI